MATTAIVLAHRSAFSEVRDGGGSFRALNPPVPYVEVGGVCRHPCAGARRAHAARVAGGRLLGCRDRHAGGDAAGRADRCAPSIRVSCFIQI